MANPSNSAPHFYSYPMPLHINPAFNSTIHSHPQTAVLAQQSHPPPIPPVQNPSANPSEAPKLYKGHSARQLHTLSACAVQLNFFSAPRGQKTVYANTLQCDANAAGVPGSAAILKDRLNDLLNWHLDSDKCPEQLRLVLDHSPIAPSFGALLDRLDEMRKTSALASDQKREVIVKKAEEDRVGGEAIRRASLDTVRSHLHAQDASPSQSETQPVQVGDNQASGSHSESLAVESDESQASEKSDDVTDIPQSTSEATAAPNSDSDLPQAAPSVPVDYETETDVPGISTPRHDCAAQEHAAEDTYRIARMLSEDPFDAHEDEDVIDITATPSTDSSIVSPIHWSGYRLYGLGPEPTSSSIASGSVSSSSLIADSTTPFMDASSKVNSPVKRKHVEQEDASPVKHKKRKNLSTPKSGRKTARQRKDKFNLQTFLEQDREERRQRDTKVLEEMTATRQSYERNSEVNAANQQALIGIFRDICDKF